MPIKDLGASMVRELKIGVFGSLDLSDIGIMILGAMYVGAMAMAVFLILVQCTSREGMRHTFPPLLRVELGVLGLSWDFWAKSVFELQLEVEQIRLRWLHPALTLFLFLFGNQGLSLSKGECSSLFFNKFLRVSFFLRIFDCGSSPVVQSILLDAVFFGFVTVTFKGIIGTY